MQCVTARKTERERGTSVTRGELQKAGASPELARILADRLPRRGSGDPTRNPLVVAVNGIVLAAFLSTLGWLVLATTGTQAGVAVLAKGQAALEERTARIKEKLDGLLPQ